MSREPQTVAQVTARLRRMLGHVGARDRATVLQAIDAILELSERLFEATHPTPKRREGSVSIRKVVEDVVGEQIDAAHDEHDGALEQRSDT